MIDYLICQTMSTNFSQYIFIKIVALTCTKK